MVSAWHSGVHLLLKEGHLDPHDRLFQWGEGVVTSQHVALLAAQQVWPDHLLELLDLPSLGERPKSGEERIQIGKERRVEQREQCPQLRRVVLQRRACGERGAGAMVSTCMRRKARSVVLFWSGVPVSMTVCSVRSARRSAAINESLFLSR